MVFFEKCLLLFAMITVLLSMASLARAAGTVDAPVNKLASDGYVRDWVLLGTFASGKLETPAADGATRDGFGRDYLGELGGEAAAQIGVNTSVTWKDASGALHTAGPAVKGAAWDNGHLGHKLFDHRVGYAFSYIESDEQREVFFYFASDGAPRVWVNGKLVVAQFTPMHKTTPWMYGRKLTMEKGLNRVLVKLDNDRGWWGFQMQMLRTEDHLAAIGKALKGIDAEEIKGEAARVTFTPRLRPQPVGFALPVTLTLAGGGVTATAEGTTGQAVTITMPKEFHGPATLTLASADPKYPLSGTVPVYVGDFSADVAGLGKRFAAVRGNAKGFDAGLLPLYEGMLAWVDMYLSSKFAGQPDKMDLDNFDYVEGLTKSLEANREFIGEHKRASFPFYFSTQSAEGKTFAGQYAVQLPPGFTGDGARYPLFISLHGSGGIGMKLVYSSGGPAVAGREEVKQGQAEVIRVTPRCPAGAHGWETPWLDALFAHVVAHLPVQEDRVYVTGFSMGGMGTWEWATDHPERFAAIAPQAGFGDPLRVNRLKGVPTWVFQGGKDNAVPPYLAELTVSALKNAGGDVTYTLYPELGHEGTRDPHALEVWLLEHTRGKGATPADPVLQLGLRKAGEVEMSEPVLVDMPAGKALGKVVEADSAELMPQVEEARQELYGMARAGGKQAQGETLLLRREELPGGKVRATVAITWTGAPPAEVGQARMEELPGGRFVAVYVRGSAAAGVAQAKAWAEQEKVKPEGEPRAYLLSLWRRAEPIWRVLVPVK